jgi:hypothetical protein
MKDVYEVLRHDDHDLARVRHEIESLNVAANLLSDDPISDELTQKKESSAEWTWDRGPGSKATGTDPI